jgi:tetratricopeptide (TPR) repeat protein
VNKSNILYAVVGLFAGFVLGFILANAVAHREQGSRRADVASTRQGAQKSVNDGATADASGASDSITEDDIRQAIAKTDARSDDISLQRGFGLALYQYATQKQDERYLPDVARLLKRAYDANPKDYELTVALGNVLFDMGQSSDPASFVEARKYYQRALEMKADDVSVRTDLGLTYYFAQPSDPRRAIAEYRKSLAINPRHEPTLQHLASALISIGDREEAQRKIDDLQNLNPSNPALPNLRAQLAQSKNAAQE